MTEFMITTRKPRGQGVGPARYLTFDTATGADTALSQAAWTARVIATFPAAPPAGPAGVRTRVGDILFLVHGFNVGHDAAKAFHVKCAAALKAAGWNGLLISYDWPSDGLVFAYLPDRENARNAASALVQAAIALLEQKQQQDCTINVHAMAHSMGCFVAQQAFVWSYQDVPPDWRVGQVLMLAADVDHTVFDADNPSAKAFVGHSARLTAYCNRYDKALMASNAKRLDLAPRMGRVGLPDDAPSMMCEVDCSALFETVYPDLGSNLSPVTTHCFYFDRPEVWQDVVLTLGGGFDRRVFPTRDPDPNNPIPNRFALKTAPLAPAAYAANLARASTSASINPGP
jgi:pimeloyl-ACP methyl ester carboxylesterase